jgi:hypothetical protein
MIRNHEELQHLSEREILALAISLEEEDERVYALLPRAFKQDFPASASVFDAMRADESGHRRRLIDLYRQKFGEHIPLIRRQDVNGFVPRKPVRLVRPLGLDAVRRQASAIEVETPGDFMKGPRCGLQMQVSANCSMTWHRGTHA